ncbi:MAG: hypothetical protein AAF327_12240 [Cyanobacteria bacterium P01_A01_bin.37]
MPRCIEKLPNHRKQWSIPEKIHESGEQRAISRHVEISWMSRFSGGGRLSSSRS